MAQYLNFYGFDRAPFCPGVTPEALYWSPSWRQLCDRLGNAIAERKGLIMLTGEEGIGKTTLLRAALKSMKELSLEVITISADGHSLPELLETLEEKLHASLWTTELSSSSSSPHKALVFKTYGRGDTISDSLPYFSSLLGETHARGMRVVVVIDDAHACSVKSLRQLRRLAGLRIKGEPLLQVILVGRPELEWKTKFFPLWRLRRQLALRTCLPPLTLNESLAYLRHRLAEVTEEQEPVFAPNTLALIAGLGDGNPYRLNVLGHNALVKGYETQQRPIPPESLVHLLRHVGNDLKKSVPVSPPLLPFLRMTGVGMVVGGIAVLSLAGFFSFWQGYSPTVVSSLRVEPAIAGMVTEAPPQEVTAGEKSIPQLQEGIPEKINSLGEEGWGQAPTRVSPPPEIIRPEPQYDRGEVVPSAPPIPVKVDIDRQPTSKRKPQQAHGKSVVTTRKPGTLSPRLNRTQVAARPRVRISPAKTLAKKPKDASPAKGGNTTKVAKAKVKTTPQQSTVARRSSPSQKKPQQQRVVQQSPVRTLTQNTNHDRLFDE
jgi:general secretion pathway protein A